MSKSCEVCFKRSADRDGVCNVYHSINEEQARIGEEAMKTEHVVRNVDLEDDWARRFIRQVQASISVTKTQVQVQVPCAEKKS